MSKRAPRLQFTDEELATLEVSKAAKKAAKRIEKLEQAEAKIPTKNGAERLRPASKLQHAVRDAPGKAVRSAAHREIRKSEDDNVGVESAHKLEEAAEQTSILAEIGTYGGTVFLEWITGVRTLDDTSWQEYVDTCNQLGAERALELEKTAVERYNSI